MFTVYVYVPRYGIYDLIRRIQHFLSVDFVDGAFSVFVLSSDDEPDILEFDSSCRLVLRNE